ncbi:MAG: aldehyde dehydrogenase family protein [Casimicrobiaceae bacterium]
MSANPSTGKDLSLPGIMPKRCDLYYDGGWHAPQSGRYVETINPASGESIARVADANAADTAAAVEAAHAAFAAWRRTKPLKRAAMLKEAAAILRTNAEELAMLDALDTGNPIAQMVNEARVAATSIEYFAGLVTEIKGQTIPMGDGNLNYTLREPLGVVARIVAYNHPLMFAAMKMGAPLAAGNTLVLKAAEQAPLSALKLAELVGGIFPPGVLNILAGGKECGQALSAHPRVKKVSLIGSVPTGRAIMRTAADSLKQVLLELGGKNALIAYPDADIDKVIAGAVAGMNFTWAGQSCGSTSRVFLHESIHDRVLEGMVKTVGARHKPGIPTEWTTTMGPLVSRAQLDKVLAFIDSANAEGARLVTGGKQPADARLANGFFVEPTIYADVTPGMRIAREEIFGPVLAVLQWNDEDALFEQVNAVEYGLTASIWTRDLNIAHRAAGRVEAGYVWINHAGPHFHGVPFGGYKQSGIGREESFEELLEFTQTKNVNVNLES